MPVQNRAPIIVLFLGLVAGAVAGWVAHRAVISPKSESSKREAAHANAASGPLAQPAEAESSASTLHPRIHASSADSRLAAPASGSTIPPSVTVAGALSAKDNSRENASTGDASEASVAWGQAPSLDDLRDAARVRCTFGPGNGGSWPNGKLTVGDAAWQGGPVDFQSIDYHAGTAQMVGQVTHSPTDGVPAAVAMSDSDVTFTGRAANGTLTVISVFGKFDNTGHHIAVMSLHDGKLDIAQFYGDCDLAQKSLNSASQ
jgi:hypothetical protein